MPSWIVDLPNRVAIPWDGVSQGDGIRLFQIEADSAKLAILEAQTQSLTYLISVDQAVPTEIRTFLRIVFTKLEKRTPAFNRQFREMILESIAELYRSGVRHG